MNFLQKLVDYCEKIKDDPNLAYHKKSLELVFDLSKSNVSDTESNLTENKNFVIAYVRSSNSELCPFNLYLGLGKEARKAMFEYNHSAPILETEIQSSVDLEEWIDAFSQHLKSAVFEELTYVKGKLIKSKYTFSYAINGNKSIYPFSTYARFTWFWERKEIKQKTYKPWL